MRIARNSERFPFHDAAAPSSTASPTPVRISTKACVTNRVEDIGYIEWLPDLKAPKLSTRGPEAVAAERVRDFLYDALQPLGE